MSKREGTLQTFGASVRGPLHRQENKHREDAWLAASGRYGDVLAVCDGLGSRPNSRFGAEAACRAVRDAIRAHSHAGRAHVPELLRMIHSLWNVRILPAAADDCATTCLFATVFPWGEVLVARLGDGVAALVHSDGSMDLVEGTERSFGNVTTGLGLARSTTEWDILTREAFPSGSAIFLATDGVSDDLRPAAVPALVAHLLERFGPMPKVVRNRALQKDLNDWPTPRHLDDKTIAVLWNRPETCHD